MIYYFFCSQMESKVFIYRPPLSFSVGLDNLRLLSREAHSRVTMVQSSHLCLLPHTLLKAMLLPVHSSFHNGGTKHHGCDVYFQHVSICFEEKSAQETSNTS